MLDMQFVRNNPDIVKENIKKKFKTSRFPQTKAPNALPHKGGRQAFCKKPSKATVFCN